MRGPKHDPDGIENAISYIHGRLEIQIEQFAASIGYPAQTLAARLAALLSPPGPGLRDNLPVVWSQTAAGSGAVEPLALAQSSHSSETQLAGINAPSETRSHQVSKQQKGYWASMTPEERSKEMKRRRKYRGKVTPERKRAQNAEYQRKMRVAKQAAERAKEKAHPKKEKRDLKKQKIYVQRHKAKLQGKPLPPLPSEDKKEAA